MFASDGALATVSGGGAVSDGQVVSKLQHYPVLLLARTSFFQLVHMGSVDVLEENAPDVCVRVAWHEMHCWSGPHAITHLSR